MFDGRLLIENSSSFVSAAPIPPDRLDSSLKRLKDTVTKYKNVIGQKKLELFFSPEIQGDDQEGWHTTKMAVKEGKHGEIIIKRKLFLDNQNKDKSLDDIYNVVLPDYDSKAYLDTDLFDITCIVRQIKGKTIIQFDTIGPAKFILNTNNNQRTVNFSTVNDPKFEEAVGGGGMIIEQCFISPDDDKISKHLVAYMDLDPSDDRQVSLGSDAGIDLDLRDLRKERHMQKVERKLDGSLIVATGRLINQKEFIWDAMRVVESANQNIEK